MLVSKWGNSLGVRLPQKLVNALGLKPGDELEVVAATPTRIVVAKPDIRGASNRPHASPCMAYARRLQFRSR